MRIISQLMHIPGVIAAGEYAYRGDRYAFEGDLPAEYARMASILCRANTLSTNMQAEILCSFAEDCGLSPVQGWIVHGRDLSVCVVGNVFCFCRNQPGVLNDVMTIMRAKVGDIEENPLVYMYAKIGGDVNERLY